MIDRNYFYIESLENGNEISLNIHGTLSIIPILEYSINEGDSWIPYTFEDILILDSYKKCYFRGDNLTFSDTNNRIVFSITKLANSGGNIMSLVDKTCESVTIQNPGQFSYLFYNCTFLITPPELPAINLNFECYSGMFEGCSLLQVAPNLPATTVPRAAYFAMFYGCSSIKELPDIAMNNLPDDAVGQNCYFMFYGCFSITDISSLFSREFLNLTVNCFTSMFENCYRLKISSSQTGAYQIPFSINYSKSTPTQALTYMFRGTGGTFTDTPRINRTYYLEALSYYNVVINIQGIGQVSGIEEKKYLEGTEVTINAIPGERYRFQSLTINGEEIEELPHTFTITEDTTINVVFVRIPTYSVNIVINGRGNVSGIEPGTYQENTSLTISSVTPNFGYTFVDCKVNGTNIYDFPYTFTLTQNTSIEASFDNLYYFITDRTQADVDYVKELNQKMILGTASEEEQIDWNIIKKGALNRGDLQRLLGAVNFITEYIGGAIVTTSIPEFPTTEWYDTFVTDIKNTVHSWYSTMVIPNSPYNTYEKWNEIERAVKTLYDIVINLMWYYCSNDDLYCEDSIII